MSKSGIVFPVSVLLNIEGCLRSCMLRTLCVYAWKYIYGNICGYDNVIFHVDLKSRRPCWRTKFDDFNFLRVADYSIARMWCPLLWIAAFIHMVKKQLPQTYYLLPVVRLPHVTFLQMCVVYLLPVFESEVSKIFCPRPGHRQDVWMLDKQPVFLVKSFCFVFKGCTLFVTLLSKDVSGFMKWGIQFFFFFQKHIVIQHQRKILGTKIILDAKNWHSKKLFNMQLYVFILERILEIVLIFVTQTRILHNVYIQHFVIEYPFQMPFVDKNNWGI